MNTELAEYLSQHTAIDEETQTWGGGSVPLQVRSYVCSEFPPEELVTSVRGIVFRETEVLVVRVLDGNVHLMPGGRREAGESFEETFRREVLEETGWTLNHVALLGFMHFFHLSPKPDGYQYAYPEFVQVIFQGEAGSFNGLDRQIGGYEVDAGLRSMAEVKMLPMPGSQMALLAAAGQAR